jgi:type IV secretion system protein TrbL
MEGAGASAQPGPGQQLTQLATGSLILLMGGFTPWVAIKMFHFTGDVLGSAHAYAAQAPSGARAVLAAPQKVNAIHSQASHTAAKFKSPGGGTPTGNEPPKDDAAPLKEESRQGGHRGGPVRPAASGKGQPAAAAAKPLAAGTGSSAAAGGSGSAAAAGGSGAAAAVAAPVAVAAATVTAAKKAATAASSGAAQAAPEPPTSPVQEWPRRNKPTEKP